MPNRNQEADYRYGYQGEYAEKEEMGSTHSFELRLWDSRIGRWTSPDPKGEFHSPYLGMGNSPIMLTDPDGGATESTHIDENGNVIDVIADGNLGVYQNGELIGHTLSINSFKEGDNIKVDSFWARDFVEKFELTQYIQNGTMGPIANALDYALGARNNFKYDPKSGGEFGSQISEGIYVSKRDVGNYTAGAYGRLNPYFASRKKELLISFGAFNIAENDIAKFTKDHQRYRTQAINFDSSSLDELENPRQKTYGEGVISNYFQRLGFEGIKTLKDWNKNYSKIWND